MSTDLLFKEKPPRQEQLDPPQARRLHDSTSAPEIGFARRRVASCRKGVVTGVQLEAVLRELAKVQGYRNFDELPIPFRAVATDLVTGKAVVFSEGDLANVMRASMSVPGAIAPAEIDGKLLVDGGLTDNLPVDVARAMGADVVIAVNLGTPLHEARRDELAPRRHGADDQHPDRAERAGLARLAQADRHPDPARARRLLRRRLRPPAEDDADRRGGGAQGGRPAGALSLPPSEYAALRRRQRRGGAARSAPGRRDPLSEACSASTPTVLEAEHGNAPGQPLDQQTLDRDMRRIYGTGDFEHVNYRIIEEPGKRVLAVDAVEKSWGPNYLRFGLGLSSDFQGDAVLQPARELPQDLAQQPRRANGAPMCRSGARAGSLTEFYQPLEARQYFFVAPYAEVERRQLDDLQQRRSGSPSTTSGTAASASTSAASSRATASCASACCGGPSARRLDTGPPLLEPDPNKVDQGAIRGRLFFDQLDNVNFPRSGYGGTVDIFDSQTALGADDELHQVDDRRARSRTRSATTPSTSASGSAGRSAPIRCRSTISSTGAASCSSRATAPARCSASRSRSAGSCTSTGSRASR